jgi:cellulose biosynthesis protein BcsQ
MSETETKDVNEFHATLKTFIENSNEYDIIILDAQAGTDNFARVATTLADQSVIVSEYDPISVQGIERLKVQFGSVLNPGNTWVLF